MLVILLEDSDCGIDAEVKSKTRIKGAGSELSSHRRKGATSNSKNYAKANAKPNSCYKIMTKVMLQY